MANKECAACGYIRRDTDIGPTYECPKCKKVYSKTDALAGKTPNVESASEASTAFSTKDIVEPVSKKKSKNLALAGISILLTATVGAWMYQHNRLVGAKTQAIVADIPVQVTVTDIQVKDGLVYENVENLPFTGKWVIKHPSGSNWFSAEFKNGRPDGIASLSYRNGNLAFKAAIGQGYELSNIFQYSYEDGTPALSGSYRGSQIPETASFWYPSGKKAIEISTNETNRREQTIWNKFGHEVFKSRCCQVSNRLELLESTNVAFDSENFMETTSSVTEFDIRAKLHCESEAALSHCYAEEIWSSGVTAPLELISPVMDRYKSKLGTETAVEITDTLGGYVSTYALVSYNVLRLGKEYSPESTTPIKYGQYRGALCAASNIWQFSLPASPSLDDAGSAAVMGLILQNSAYSRVVEDFIYSPEAMELTDINEEVRKIGNSIMQPVIQLLEDEIERLESGRR